MPLPFAPIWALCVAGVVVGRAVANAGESFVDNVFRDAVTPVRGSVLYCDMAFGNMDHSGIYVGNNQIVQLGKSGYIKCVSPREFIRGTTAISIYVSCIDESAVGDERAADCAEALVGSMRDYSLLTNNCHTFCSECLTGQSNTDTFLWMLKLTAKQSMGVNTWRVWDIGTDDLF